MQAMLKHTPLLQEEWLILDLDFSRHSLFFGLFPFLANWIMNKWPPFTKLIMNHLLLLINTRIHSCTSCCNYVAFFFCYILLKVIKNCISLWATDIDWLKKLPVDITYWDNAGIDQWPTKFCDLELVQGRIIGCFDFWIW